MLKNVQEPDSSRSRGPIEKYWSYSEVVRSIPEIEDLVKEIPAVHIAEMMAIKKYLSFKKNMNPSNDEDKNKLKELYEKYTNAQKESAECYDNVVKKGICIINAIHGIVCFPFYHSEKDTKAVFIYRQGELRVNTWMTKDEINEELAKTADGTMPSNINAGIVNPIPSEWKESVLSHSFSQFKMNLKIKLRKLRKIFRRNH